MYTRLDYINGKCYHDEYYSQFVNTEIIKIVETMLKRIPDPKLHHWDRLDISEVINRDILFNLTGSRNYTLSDQVCIAKQAAKFIDKEL